MKLLCSSLFDSSLYRDWRKLATGAYGTVYETTTNLSEPTTVAIKQMKFPTSIYDRCVLHDIFTEITCLEAFRLEPCVTDLYDYGVDDNNYFIVMKKYQCSLKEWRLKQTKSLQENLSLYLSIYKDILKSISLIHSHNVSHYDIKCDNILLEPKSSGSSSISRFGEENGVRVTVGDFGECRMFTNEKDEFCTRNRGTDYIKSPEMLTLTISTRKDTDKYDRRK
jgi:serine/threonine protein kinase